MDTLNGRIVVLGITGSIAAYKAADLASKLTQVGAQVDAVLTEAATHFITPLALRSVTRRPVYADMFDPASELAEGHVELARRADAVLVAPATATTIARLAHGLASDLVSLTVLATRAPVLVAPAMDAQMYENPATQANLLTLRERGFTIVGPAEGRLASGRWGRRGDLAGRRLVVTAGTTQEPIDPVRFVGNYSSGKMGYALAEAARDRGAEVTLVSGPTALDAPYGVELISVRTALELRDAVVAASDRADALVMAAAPVDYRLAAPLEQKIKRSDESLTLEMVPNPDILAGVRGELVKVGFAAESEDLIKNAEEKLRKKGADLFVANDITAGDAGFGVETNRVTIIDASGGSESLPLLSKYEVAHRVLDRVVELLKTRS
jgi:phosphopantothenoylcysteine decarboxylase/phosphopantothenate--cysteine ligase